MEPLHNILPLNYQPQQKEFFFEKDNLKFSSKFDSGNMLKADKINENIVHIFNLFTISFSLTYKYHLIAKEHNKNSVTGLGFFFL